MSRSRPQQRGGRLASPERGAAPLSLEGPDTRGFSERLGVSTPQRKIQDSVKLQTPADYLEVKGKLSLSEALKVLEPASLTDGGVGCLEVACPEYGDGYERALALEIFARLNVRSEGVREVSRTMDIPLEGLRARATKVRTFLRFFIRPPYVLVERPMVKVSKGPATSPQLSLFDELIPLPGGREMRIPWRPPA